MISREVLKIFVSCLINFLERKFCFYEYDKEDFIWEKVSRKIESIFLERFKYFWKAHK